MEKPLSIQSAALCYLVANGHVLLIHKKRGIGKGKINAPGGKIEPLETTLAAAIRETQEETGIVPLNPKQYGRLLFEFSDSRALDCHIFLANQGYKGTLIETDEALPEWYPLDQLPYDQMWEDDKVWLPMLLNQQYFQGRVIVGEDNNSVSASEIRQVKVLEQMHVPQRSI